MLCDTGALFLDFCSHLPFLPLKRPSGSRTPKVPKEVAEVHVSELGM